MGVFGAFFGCRGDAGFKASLLGVSSGVGGFNVAMLLRLVREKFALRGLMVGVSAKKFAQRTRNAPKLAFCGVLGEFFRGNAAGGGVLGELCRAVGLAAEPFYWRPADTQLNPIGGMVGRPPRPPPSGLTCG